MPPFMEVILVARPISSFLKMRDQYIIVLVKVPKLPIHSTNEGFMWHQTIIDRFILNITSILVQFIYKCNYI